MGTLRGSFVAAIVGLLLLLSALPVLAAPHAGNPGGNCDGWQNAIETSDGSIELAAGTSVCIHAGGTNTGTMTVEAGGETLAELILRSGILNNGGQVPNVSNYVVYSVPEEPPDAPTVTATGCEEVGGQGAITIDGIAEGVTVNINGVGSFTEDQSVPVDPGLYGWRAIFDGEAIGSGTVTVGDCPTPPPVITLALEGVCVFALDGTGDLVWEVTASEATSIDGVLDGGGSFPDFAIDAGSTLFTFGVAGDGGLVVNESGNAENIAAADEPTEECAPDVTPPPPPVDTGGGPGPLATVPPTDTAPPEDAALVFDPFSNPMVFLGIFLIALAVIGTALQARRARNERDARDRAN